MRIIVDAMGGDFGPPVVVPGAVDGARREGVALTLVGRIADIEAALPPDARQGVDLRIVDAPDVIDMDESAGRSTRQKPNSSIGVGLRLLKNGEGDAFLSAGHSGAVMTAALLWLGRIPGVERPAIAGPLPTISGRTLMVDLGAVADPRPQHLHQFAHLGSVLVQRMHGIPTPTVALLSNGEEASKGNQRTVLTHELLKYDPTLNFVGNLDGKDMFLGKADVIVTDGFTGNIALKSAEGAALAVMSAVKSELTSSLPRRLLSLPLRRAFRAARRRIDHQEFAAAPLLGVNGTVLISHGRSDHATFANAVRAATAAARAQLPTAITEAFLPIRRLAEATREERRQADAPDLVLIQGNGGFTPGRPLV